MYGLILNADRFTFSFKPSITPKRKLTAEMGGTGPSSNKHTPVSHSQSRKHTPVSDSQYNDYLRPRLPAQGEGASNGSAITLQQTRKPQRIGALADTEGRKPGLTSQLNSHFCWRRRKRGCFDLVCLHKWLFQWGRPHPRTAVSREATMRDSSRLKQRKSPGWWARRGGFLWNKQCTELGLGTNLLRD